MILKIQMKEKAIEIYLNRNLRIPSCVSLLCEMEIYFAEITAVYEAFKQCVFYQRQLFAKLCSVYHSRSDENQTI